MENLDLINIGAMPNDRQGDPNRDAFAKVNANDRKLKTGVDAAQAAAVVAHTAAIKAQSTADGAASAAAQAQHQADRAGADAATAQATADSAVTAATRAQTTATTAGLAAAAAQTTADMAVPLAQKGIPHGVATLGAGATIPESQVPPLYGTLLMPPETDLNSLDVPGDYFQLNNEAAAAGHNYPVPLAGHLAVAATPWSRDVSTQGDFVYQRYRVYTLEQPREFLRTRYLGTWGPWAELAGVGQVQAALDRKVDRVALTGPGVDLDALHAGPTCYTWDAAATMAGGTHFPPHPANRPGALWSLRISAAVVMQTAEVHEQDTSLRNARYVRSGDPSTGQWSRWLALGAVSAVSQLPRQDAGDVYVDGVGWHRWNGTAYARVDMVTRDQLDAIKNGVRALVYRQPGTYTFAMPAPTVYLDGCAGGGGGGGGSGYVGTGVRLNGAGGGAGLPVLGWTISAPVGSTVTVSIGAGGAGGTGGGVSGAGGGGLPGGPTTVKVNGNTVVTLDPGQGGQGGSAGGPALGGAGYPVGGDATAGDVTSVASWVTSGAGASGPFGGGGGARANRFELMAGMPAYGHGAGGGGGTTPAGAQAGGGAGGAGAGGFAKFYW
ncbi:pyocin knob domain-containing protein [Achromobacter sp. DH1f]|uniref:pyocin knob domain-containing protein n=1 Tax=Achromobacter sp. DH1f TaxID=1397275 RepID=UPI000469E1DA|nr:pyocin knob domain-containing protein [Achromobacter sp. DH1f]